MAVNVHAQGVGRSYRLHLLLAEDEPEVVILISGYFVDAGFCVTKAADGMEALDVLPTIAFDLLLTDIRMPRVDDVKLVQYVRQSHPNRLVVVLSGYMAAGADRQEHPRRPALNKFTNADEAEGAVLE
jgi:CheY-like chemotaxis protein